jgi:hypothetical protein
LAKALLSRKFQSNDLEILATGYQGSLMTGDLEFFKEIQPFPGQSSMKSGYRFDFCVLPDQSAK